GANRMEPPATVAGATTTSNAARRSPRSSTQGKPPAPAVTNRSAPAKSGASTTTTPRDGYLGVSHSTCNLRDGANKTNARRRPDPRIPQPYRSSQRWCDDPPVGTINLDGGRHSEIYVGNGDWQPLDAPSERS